MEPLTHLTIAPKIQVDLETRKGPNKVGNVVGLGGLEWSAPCIPVITNLVIAFVGRFPLVPL